MALAVGTGFDCFDATEGLEHYRAAQLAGSGVIIAGGHCGSWELTGLYMQQELKGSIHYKPGRARYNLRVSKPALLFESRDSLNSANN